MAMTLKKIFVFIFCFLYITVSASDINNNDFKLILGEEWVKINDEDLRKYESEVLTLSAGKDTTVYQYGFSLNESSNFTSGPYILINVQRIIIDKNINLKRLNEIENTYHKTMGVGNATFDNSHNYYWQYYDDDYNQVEKHKVFYIQKLSKFGKVSIYFYAKKSDFTRYDPIFKKIAYTLSFKKEDDIQLMMNEQLIKQKSENETFKIVMMIFWAIVTSVATYILNRLFNNKKPKLEVKANELKIIDNPPVQIKPSEVLIETNTVDTPIEDRKGIFISDDNTALMSSELQSALLLANYRIGISSRRITLLLIFIGATFPFFLYSGIFDAILGINLSKLQVWRIYILTPILFIILSPSIGKFFQKRAYIKEKNNIQIIAKKSGFSKYNLITFIDKYQQLYYISLFLKNDAKNKWT